MGEVWKAEHRMLARPSAIKLVRSEVCGMRDSQAGTLHRRFEREVQATAALRSPHTVAVYDFGSTDEGCFYYVMELLNGFDLETLVQRFGPQPPERVANFLLQACESLAEAHSNGLTHRDIKPKNIFVCRLGLQYDFIKVLDFGLVKSSSAPDVTQEQLTIEGTTTGTPAYMPPELALGKSDADARGDPTLWGVLLIGCSQGNLCSRAAIRSRCFWPIFATSLSRLLRDRNWRFPLTLSGSSFPAWRRTQTAVRKAQ
jgi:serine/threonine-protein kinase